MHKKMQDQIRKTVQNEKPDKPWFDFECQNIKNELSKIAKKIKSQPQNLELRPHILKQKKLLKQTINRKKREHRNSILNKMTEERNGHSLRAFQNLRY